MTTLHTVNKSPFERNSAMTCLRLSEKGSAILFIEDGVLGALRGTIFEQHLKDEKINEKRFYVLLPDIEARGFSRDDVTEDAQCIDYEGFVDLVATHDRTHAWL